MNERKILLFILFVIVYCMYSVHMWFMKENSGTNATQATEAPLHEPEIPVQEPEIPHSTEEIQPEIVLNKEAKQKQKLKFIPFYLKDSCSIWQIFTEKSIKLKPKEKTPEDMDANTVTVIGITVLLVALALNAILDVLKVKEEERARRKLNPDGERRQSLSEFANKKTLRRESSKFSLQLFQIAESFVSGTEEKKPRRQTKPYTRGDSTNSYLSEIKPKTEGSAPASISESSSGEPKLVKRQSVAKLFGARPARMVRRSSFPALPLNPEVQALMLGHRQSSIDSDDEDGRGRRVRIIRRY